MRRLILAALLLCSCSSLPQGNPSSVLKSHVVNGCAVDAVNFQAQLDPTKIIWSRILHIYFYNNGFVSGHSMCVFKDLDGKVHAWDIRGYFAVDGSGEQALDVANQVLKNVERAYYE